MAATVIPARTQVNSGLVDFSQVGTLRPEEMTVILHIAHVVSAYEVRFGDSDP
jgi:hypothetical protein